MKTYRRRLLILIPLILLLSAAVAFAEGLDVYFLDVGQGNAAFVECDGYTMLIDGGPVGASGYVYSFLKSHDVSRIDYMVATHPDLDHVGGLPAALAYTSAGTVLGLDADPQFDDFKKYLDLGGNRILVPAAGDTFSLGEASITVLGPERGMTYSKNTSLVLRIEYGKTSFLFPGDSEIEDENALISGGRTLKSTVLCVGHHGSSYSSAERFLKKVAPEYAVISVGADNTYGHPSDQVIKRLQKLKTTVYRTDRDGQIRFHSDGKSVSVVPEYLSLDGSGLSAEEPISRALPEKETEEDVPTYIGNKNSKKFHYPGCTSVGKMKSSNKVFFYGDRGEPVSLGYVPCKICNP